MKLNKRIQGFTPLNHEVWPTKLPLSKHFLLLVFIPCIILTTAQDETDIDNIQPVNICYNSSLEGLRLNVTVIKPIVVLHWIDCVMECATDACCRSINYKKTVSLPNEPNCEMLHDVLYNTSEKMLENNSSYDHVYLENPEKVYNESCFPKLVERNAKGQTTTPKMYKSCKEALEQNSSLTSGQYVLQLDEQSAKYKVYCHMEARDGQECQGGGWTLVMKTDGSQPTFKYDSVWWENNQTYNIDQGVDIILEVETKLASYSNTPFTKICLGMRVGNAQTTWIGIDYQASSLYSLIAPGKFKALSVQVDAQKWESLIDGSDLPAQCPFQGFNVPSKIHQQKRVRLGYLGHKRCANNFYQDEGVIGFGTKLNGMQHSSGYNFPSRDTNGNKQITAFGYIYVH